jgi:two-component system NtrC family response regulator
MSSDHEPASYRLLVLGDGSVRTLPLHGHRWVVGRSADCHVPLRDPTVSRRHLLLERNGEQFTFQDLGGSNPVLLDGKPCKQGVLEPDQTLTVGLTRLVLERRAATMPVATTAHPTVVLSREVADDELLPTATTSFASTAARVLERIEWTFADLGDLTHAAEPLLDLALNLTGRRCGWIGRFTSPGQPETLASLDTAGRHRAVTVPAEVFVEARRIGRPHVLTTEEGGASRVRLMIPLGTGSEVLIVLEDASADAPNGQDLLRLARSLSTVAWHRLQETLERLRLRDELQRLRFHGTAAHNALLASMRLHEARQALRALAGGSEPVLLIGEDGTELQDLARYLHSESPRRAQPFVTWSPTRAQQPHQGGDLFRDGDGADGAWQRASGGTLFLDHFERLPAALHVRLARTVQAAAKDERMPPLLVAATSHAAALPEADGGLVWSAQQRILVPPLRTNPRDVMALAELFLSELGTRADGTPRLLTERAKRLLVAYSWPGNVRELRLVLESAAAAAGDQPIAPRHLPSPIAAEQGAPANDIATLEDVERLHIVEVLHRTGGNRSRTAQLLGIASSTLYEKMKRYRIEG